MKLTISLYEFDDEHEQMEKEDNIGLKFYSKNSKIIDFFGINVIISMEDKYMRLIKRDRYLNQLINVIGVPDIKIITEVRRSGKSKLLEAFKKYWLLEQDMKIILMKEL